MLRQNGAPNRRTLSEFGDCFSVAGHIPKRRVIELALSPEHDQAHGL